MARKSVNYTVSDEGRDKGKVFVINEMSAAHAESWAMRALLALVASKVELPEGFEQFGMAGLAEIGIKSLGGIKWEVAEPLLEEMFRCLQIIPDPSRTNVIRDLVESDIEEVSTRFKLRMEIFKLHTDFLAAAAPSISAARATAAIVGGTKRHTSTSRGR